jgi:hypothetical protein
MMCLADTDFTISLPFLRKRTNQSLANAIGPVRGDYAFAH